ncbi:hypothetical protein BGZ79_006844 [Entomortierella chlamydospora]|nr:hypothetical protein BGZ79_006844 [Entomortierella chlamydospora]
MESHSSAAGTGQGSASASHASSSLTASNDPINNNSGLQRRSRPTYFSNPHSTSTISHVNRPSAFTKWDETEFPSQIEGSGMKRTASYSSFLTKKSGSFYKSSLHHVRALSGQTLSPEVYSPPPDDTLPTTLTKTPTYEYYGFVLYLVSGITYGNNVLGLGIPPKRGPGLHGNHLLSKQILVTSFADLALDPNPNPESTISNHHLCNISILDEHANQFQTMNSASSLTDDFVPDLMDIPIGMVNACLYQHIEGISDEEEEVEDGDDYDDDDGSYFDDSNASDWENSAELR